MGNDFRIGIEIGNNRGHGGHGGYPPDRFPDDRFPQYPHQHPRIDPITFEARQIANDLDSGNAERAAERLRQDLQRMPTFRDQRDLVERVDAFDRKGVGADIHLKRPDRAGGIWDDICITPPRYYDRGGQYGQYGRPIPGDGRYGREYPPVYRQPQVDIRIDLNLFKNHGRR